MRLGGRRFLLSLAILAASVSLALGVSLPIIKLTKYMFWTTEHSLLSTGGTVLLFQDASHADQKWRAAAALIAEPEFASGSYVDLTVPRRPAVSAGAPAAGASETLPEGSGVDGLSG